MSEGDFKTLISRIDRLTRVIALDAIKEKAPQDQVKTLDSLGFTQTEIAAVTGMSQGNVSKILKKLHGNSSGKPQESNAKSLEGEEA
jgi:DNA-binding MarR family transcriptional regulator